MCQQFGRVPLIESEPIYLDSRQEPASGGPLRLWAHCRCWTSCGWKCNLVYPKSSSGLPHAVERDHPVVYACFWNGERASQNQLKSLSLTCLHPSRLPEFELGIDGRLHVLVVVVFQRELDPVRSVSLVVADEDTKSNVEISRAWNLKHSDAIPPSTDHVELAVHGLSAIRQNEIVCVHVLRRHTA